VLCEVKVEISGALLPGSILALIGTSRKTFDSFTGAMHFLRRSLAYACEEHGIFSPGVLVLSSELLSYAKKPSVQKLRICKRLNPTRFKTLKILLTVMFEAKHLQLHTLFLTGFGASLPPVLSSNAA